MNIAITGASGFVGGHLARQFRATGYQVAALSRNALSRNTADSIPYAIEPYAIEPYAIEPYAIEQSIAPDKLRGFDLLVHAAWDFQATDDRNLTGSTRLFDAAREAGVPHAIFISSLSAFEGCASHYGRTKLALEKQLAGSNIHIVRLGFVCDASQRGMSGGLKKLARLPVIPLPGGGAQNLFTIDAGDLAPALLRIVSDAPAGVVSLAHPAPVSLARMLRTFAREQGANPLFLPIPWRLLWLPLRAAEAAGLHFNFRSDSLVSLVNQNPAPDFRFVRESGLKFREFSAAAEMY